MSVILFNKSTKKEYFKKVTNKGFVSNRVFWDTVKPFLTNKGFLTNENIGLEHKGEIISDDIKLAEIFNNHYINIVEKSSSVPPENIGNPDNQDEAHMTVRKIIDHCKNHPSILSINNVNPIRQNFDIPPATTEQINKIIKELNPRKATGPDKIPSKIVKLSANIIDSHLANIINNDLSKNCFSKNARVASVRPIFKKNGPEKF